MLNEHDHATRLMKSCQNMKKCRDAAKAVKKRRMAKGEFDLYDEQPGSASTPSDPLTNLQR